MLHRKHRQWKCSLLILLFGCQSITLAVPTMPEEQQVVLREEYERVKDIRRRLRDILDYQAVQDSLQQSDDIYTGFQQLEEWIQQMEDGQQGEQQMKDFLESMNRLEEALRNSVKQQQQLSYEFSKGDQPDPQQIPVQEVMKAIKELVKSGNFEEAKKLLDQLMSAYLQQQQQLQQSMSEHYQKKFQKQEKQLKAMQQKLQEATSFEQKVVQQLRKLRHQQELSEADSEQMHAIQEQISENIQNANESFQNLQRQAMLPTQDMQKLMEMLPQQSLDTQKALEQRQSQESLKTAQKTLTSLRQMQRQMQQYQRQMQQMQQSSQNQKPYNGKDSYRSDKLVKPLQMQQDFQGNPEYREEIQKYNQENLPGIAPQEQRYLHEIIR